MDFATLMTLEPKDLDVWSGTGPRYPWGGLYGGQVVAQALRAASYTVDTTYRPHSLHASFIRAGDPDEPTRYEVGRLRDGRSFRTRRVAAVQSVGPILEMTASFHVDEPGRDRQGTEAPEVPRLGTLEEDSWTEIFERRVARRDGGEVRAWLRMTKPVGDDPVLQACALAYVSDDFPTEAVVSQDSTWDDTAFEEQYFSASLDHAMWFHRPIDVDEWHEQVYRCTSLAGARGLSIGQVFSAEGVHLATVSQEVLLRDRNRG